MPSRHSRQCYSTTVHRRQNPLVYPTRSAGPGHALAKGLLHECTSPLTQCNV